MAVRSAGMCSPKRRRRLDRLLSIVCRFLLLASMDLWSISCSLLKTEGSGCFHYVRGCLSIYARGSPRSPLQSVTSFHFVTSSFLVPPWHGCRRADIGQSAGSEWRSGVSGVPARPLSAPDAPPWPGSPLLLSD